MNEKQISLLAAFLAAHVEYAVVGGLAVNAYGYVRATNDLDILSAPPKRTLAPPSPPFGRWELRSKV